MKLAGVRYLKYWQLRARRRGPGYVGRNYEPAEVEAQADLFWGALSKVLPRPPLTVVTEFGCGWGRIASRLKEQYPTAAVNGIEMVDSTIEYGRTLFDHNVMAFWPGDHYLPEIPHCNLLVTCTALQHVTDPLTWASVVTSFHKKVLPGGWLIMLENDRIGKGSPHMTDRVVEDYIKEFDGFDFVSVQRYPKGTLDRERHAVMAARRKRPRHTDESARPDTAASP